MNLVIGYWCIGLLEKVGSRQSAVGSESSHWSLVIGHWGAGLPPCIAGLKSHLYKKKRCIATHTKITSYSLLVTSFSSQREEKDA